MKVNTMSATPLLYDVQRFNTNGYYDELHFQFITHDPNCNDRQVVVKFSQSVLVKENIGETFVRTYPLVSGSYSALSSPSRGMDFSYIPDRPTKKHCESIQRVLQKMNADGTLVFAQKKIKAAFGSIEVTELETHALDPKWNDSHWMHPEEYLNLIAKKV
jgi:hypothetical protein